QHNRAPARTSLACHRGNHRCLRGSRHRHRRRHPRLHPHLRPHLRRHLHLHLRLHPHRHLHLRRRRRHRRHPRLHPHRPLRYSQLRFHPRPPTSRSCCPRRSHRRPSSTDRRYTTGRVNIHRLRCTHSLRF